MARAAHRPRDRLGVAQIVRLLGVHDGQIRPQHPGGRDAGAQVEPRQGVAAQGLGVLRRHDPPAARPVAVREGGVEQPPPDPPTLMLGRDGEERETPEPLAHDRVRAAHHLAVDLGDPLPAGIELEVAREAQQGARLALGLIAGRAVVAEHAVGDVLDPIGVLESHPADEDVAAAVLSFAHGRTQAEAVARPHDAAPLAAQGVCAGVQRVPAVPQPPPSPQGLPRVRPLRRQGSGRARSRARPRSRSLGAPRSDRHGRRRRQRR